MPSAPPAVEVALASGRRDRWLVAAVHALAAAVSGAWLAAHAGIPLHAAWPAVALLGGGVGWRMLQPMHGHLRWDGERWWHLPKAGAAHALHGLDLMMDLGGWVLLRARCTDGWRGFAPGLWCGISRREAGDSWHGLRLALYQSPGSAAPPGRALQ